MTWAAASWEAGRPAAHRIDVWDVLAFGMLAFGAFSAMVV